MLSLTNAIVDGTGGTNQGGEHHSSAIFHHECDLIITGKDCWSSSITDWTGLREKRDEIAL